MIFAQRKLGPLRALAGFAALAALGGIALAACAQTGNQTGNKTSNTATSGKKTATKTAQGAKDMFVYVGTYTNKDSKGIYVYRLDGETGQLSFTEQTAMTSNPSYLDIHPTGRYLYAANEVWNPNEKPGSGVSAFAIDAKTGGLTFLNWQSSRGGGPCHLSIAKNGRLLTVANYGGGSVAALPIQADGKLGEASSFHQHVGSSVNPQRQKEPHTHSSTLDAADRFAYVADLGLDKILIYRVDHAKGELIPNDTPWAQIHPGAGPRHFAIHPANRYAYVINELDSTISRLAYDAEKGTLKETQTVSTLPEGFSGDNSCADIHISASGKFLYGSNRGHNSIAIFSIDLVTGSLTPIGHVPTQGRTPRNFGIDPSGKFLLVANQESNNIVIFRMDAETGQLTPTGQTVEVPAPVCVKFLPVNS